MGEDGEKAQTSIYNRNKSWDYNMPIGDYS